MAKKAKAPSVKKRPAAKPKINPLARKSIDSIMNGDRPLPRSMKEWVGFLAELARRLEFLEMAIEGVLHRLSTSEVPPGPAATPMKRRK